MNEIAKYIYEAGMLKRVKRSGWWIAGVENPESIAEHTFRAAVIAFVLAKMEGHEDEVANRACTAAVFHDLHETRLTDLNKITSQYIDVERRLERKIERDQVSKLPKQVKEAILGNLELSEIEYQIVKDADYIECAFQAKEYLKKGHETRQWLENIKTLIKTKSGKRLYGEFSNTKSDSWWHGLKKTRRSRD